MISDYNDCNRNLIQIEYRKDREAGIGFVLDVLIRVGTKNFGFLGDSSLNCRSAFPTRSCSVRACSCIDRI